MSIDEWILLVALVVIALGVLGVGFRRAIKDVEEQTEYIDRFALVSGRPSEVRCILCASLCVATDHFVRNRERFTAYRCPRCAK